MDYKTSIVEVQRRVVSITREEAETITECYLETLRERSLAAHLPDKLADHLGECAGRRRVLHV